MTAAFRQVAAGTQPIGPIGPIESGLAGLFPAGTAVAAVQIGAAGMDSAALHPAEATAVAGAVPARQAEFAAGRAAARRALAALGHPGAAVPRGPGRAPLWPAGIGGSIAHGAGVAVAAVRAGGPLGLDLEEDAPLEPALWPLVCTAEELERELAALPGATARGRLVRRIFAAKEAVYKAQYPLTGALIGFEAVTVRLVAGGFVARFREDLPGLPPGQAMAGRFAHVPGPAGGLILAGVAA
jgi:4'-phosphopantetheinyl transferase EntD